ncbi:DUF998 domain-containing protein [Amycolatopsis benzoatilytica]|uniref:DUF998 domain-containing protein n=1 Tax=Amycolatopsis benzoatilytica TaxID=346045 RepID=UPI00047FF193|nr:DUF998 domain-containing protein [Amycolatopsis benzoatilytica]
MTTVRADRRPALLSLAGIGALALGAVLMLLLQVVLPTNEISATWRTISEYGLSDHKWMFDLAVVLVAAGSAIAFAVLRLQGRLPRAAAVLGALWTAGLLVIVAFPKTDWANAAASSGPGGALHRAASVVAFVCLPVAVLVAARAAFPDQPRRRWLVRALAIAALAWFAVIIGAIAVAALTGQHWWLLIPLGLVERGMALTELLALAALSAPGRGKGLAVDA